MGLRCHNCDLGKTAARQYNAWGCRTVCGQPTDESGSSDLNIEFPTNLSIGKLCVDSQSAFMFVSTRVGKA
jgi:hypothetical protein